MEKEITNKCEGIIESLGLGQLADEKKVEIVERTTALVCDRIILKLMKRVSDAEIEEANEIMSGEDEDKKLEFITIKMPDFANVLDEEIKGVKEEIKQSI